MDTPRKWQIASVATAVASMGIGGLMLARPTSEAVASIDLDPITDRRELNVASPGSAPSTLDDSPEALRWQIVPSAAIDGLSLTSTPARSTTSVDSPDPDTTGGTPTGQPEPTQPAPSTPPPDSPDSSSSPDSPASIDSSSSIDS